MRKQPHFDDERTVLRARQVVPLQEIEGKVRSRRRWFLGGAFAVAMLLGAASALVSAYFKMRTAPDPEIEPAAVTTVSEEAVLPVVEIAPPRVQPKPKPRNTDETDKKIARPPVVLPHLSEKEDLRRIRDAVLTDEWQERRERRVARREQRRSQHRERDLSNLDEIFEGRRRP